MRTSDFKQLVFSIFRFRFFAIVCVMFSACTAVQAHDGEAKHDRRPHDIGRVLVFSGTGWYRHPETAAINGWLARRSNDLGMQVDVTESPKDIDLILDRYDVLVLNNCNELVNVLNESQRRSVQRWYQSGGGIVALHAALVHQTQWEWFSQLAGCDFDSDSEYLEAKVLVEPSAKDHPAVRGFGESFQYTADWTNHDRSVTDLDGFQVLLRVDESTYDPVRQEFIKRGGKAMGQDHPVAWLHQNGGGRFFYTELGHDVRSLNTKFGTQHLTEAIRWAAKGRDPRRGELQFEDTFHKDRLSSKWRVPIAHFEVIDKKLVGREDADKGHGAVSRADLSFRDSMFDFSFRIGDAKGFNFVINDKNCESVHAGHICRVRFTPKEIRIADDKEGAMNLQIRERLRGITSLDERKRVLKGREKVVAIEIDRPQWHHARVVLIEDQITVAVDGKLVGSLKSAGIAHPTKTDFGFTVTGGTIEFDDVRAWTVSKTSP